MEKFICETEIEAPPTRSGMIEVARFEVEHWDRRAEFWNFWNEELFSNDKYFEKMLEIVEYAQKKSGKQYVAVTDDKRDLLIKYDVNFVELRKLRRLDEKNDS